MDERECGAGNVAFVAKRKGQRFHKMRLAGTERAIQSDDVISF